MATESRELAACTLARNYARYGGFYGPDPMKVEFSVREINLMRLAVETYKDPDGMKETVDLMVDEYLAEQKVL